MGTRIYKFYICIILTTNRICWLNDGHLTHYMQRYQRSDKRSRLPQWIQEHISDSVCNLSTDEAVHICKRFLRNMAQPFTRVITKSNAMLIKVFSPIIFVIYF